MKKTGTLGFRFFYACCSSQRCRCCTNRAGGSMFGCFSSSEQCNTDTTAYTLNTKVMHGKNTMRYESLLKSLLTALLFRFWSLVFQVPSARRSWCFWWRRWWYWFFFWHFKLLHFLLRLIIFDHASRWWLSWRWRRRRWRFIGHSYSL